MSNFEDIEQWAGRDSEQGNSPSENEDIDSDENAKSKDNSVPWITVAAIALVTAFVSTGIAAYFVGKSSEDTNGGTASAEKTEEGSQNLTDSSDRDTSNGGLLSNSDYEDQVKKDGAPWLVGNLSNYDFTLTGEVSSEQEKAALEQILKGDQGIFLDRATIDIEVNPDVSPASWLAPAENAPFPPIVLLSGGLVENLIDGGFALGEDRSIAFGRAPREIDKEQYGQMLTAFSGSTEIQNQIVITDLRAPTVDVSYIDGVMKITGALPDREIVRILEENTKTLFPDVDNQLTVDPKTFANFNFARFGTNMQVIQHLDEFSYSVVDGVYSITIADRIGFTSGSSDLSPQAEVFIENFTALPTFRTRNVRIVGYTDNKGDPDANLELSQDRANSVKELLIANGFPEPQIITEGKGASEFVAPNETEADRAKNRRIVFSVLRQY